MSSYYRKWAIAIAVQVVIASLMGGGYGSSLAFLMGGLCLAPGWVGLVGSIEDAISQRNQDGSTRLFAALIAAPATLGMVLLGCLAFLVGWAIAIIALLT
jgi:hypothetical protein